MSKDDWGWIGWLWIKLLSVGIPGEDQENVEESEETEEEEEVIEEESEDDEDVYRFVRVDHAVQMSLMDYLSLCRFKCSNLFLHCRI